MAKTKVAILGGGMAGLAAAYHLTRTPALRAQHEVTVHTLGWRLGGKAASGRDAMNRSIEHGLHVWFGCYENTVRMLREIYATKAPAALPRWTDALKPQALTPIGVLMDDGWTYVNLEWPSNAGTPGDGSLFPSLWDIVTEISDLVRIMLEHVTNHSALTAYRVPEVLPSHLLALFQVAANTGLDPRSAAVATAAALASAEAHTPADVGRIVHLWSRALGSDPLSLGAEHPPGIVELLDAGTRGLITNLTAETSADIRLMTEAIAIFQACLRGLVVDIVLPDAALDTLDDSDFRDWLVGHGADAGIVAASSVVRLIYDTAFQYIDGDPDQPSCAAGTALGCCLRLVGTYKGSMMYELQSGIGEALIGPLYESLLDSGVKFQFFHKVTSLDLTDEGDVIGQIRIARQVDMADGNGPYRPTFALNGLTCWPAEPDWTQLKNGPHLQAQGVDFESHWCDCTPAGDDVLLHGQHFDTVVLAVALGAYKPLNGDPGMCDALIAQGGPFADFVQNVGIVPTLSLQLWSDATLPQLGWTAGKAASVSGPEVWNIWADMSQVLATEPRPASVEPKTLHYLCGTYSTRLYRRAAAQADTPAAAKAEVRNLALQWLKTQAYGLWPLACDRHDFQWQVLTDPQGRGGNARLDAQYWRANISPTECCTMSAAGTTRFRLPPDGSGFANLVLAGEGCRHGFNATAIEGAVMSGMAAARAIAGEPRSIIGYDFLTTDPSDFLV